MFLHNVPPCTNKPEPKPYLDPKPNPKDRVIAPPPPPPRASSSSSASAKPARPLSEPEFPPYHKGRGRSHSNPNLLSEEELDRVLMADDSVFLDGFHLQEAEIQVGVCVCVCVPRGSVVAV